MKELHVTLEPETHYRFKRKALEHRTSMASLIRSWIKEFLRGDKSNE